MKKDTLIRIHRIYGILLSISIIIAGICLIAGSLTIYFTGERIYSREIVSETFSGIATPVYTCLALTIIGFIWEFLSPAVNQKQKPAKAYDLILERLICKRDLSKCEEVLIKAINKERNTRKLHVTIRTILLCAGSIVFLIYALNGNHFHQSEITTSMIHAMWLLIPCMAVPFIYAVFTFYYNEKSMQREVELLKQAPIFESKQNSEETSVKSSEKTANILRYSLLVIAVGILVYGFISGGTVDVLTKAINICTECIGLG